jgi:hypothetical protein
MEKKYKFSQVSTATYRVVETIEFTEQEMIDRKVLREGQTVRDWFDAIESGGDAFDAVMCLDEMGFKVERFEDLLDRYSVEYGLDKVKGEDNA